MLRSEKSSLLLFALSTYSSATSYPIMFAFANIMRTLFFAHCPNIPHYNNELPEKPLETVGLTIAKKARTGKFSRP